METGTRAAALGGFTAVHAMANTEPVADTAGVVEQVWRLGREAGYCDVYPVGAVTVGLAGERLAELGAMADSAARVRVFSDDGKCVSDAVLMRRALEYVKAFDGVIAQHAQEPRLTEGAQMNEGELSGRLGLTGWPAVAEEAIIARDCLLAAHVGSRLHVCHVSTAGSVEIVRQAKRKGWNVTAEACPHHLLLTDDLAATYDPIYKVNPPLRTAAPTSRRCARGWPTAPSTSSPPTTRRTRTRTRTASGPRRRSGCSGSRPRCRSCRRRWSTPGLLDWAGVAERMSYAPARIGRVGRPRPAARGGRAGQRRALRPVGAPGGRRHRVGQPVAATRRTPAWSCPAGSSRRSCAAGPRCWTASCSEPMTTREELAAAVRRGGRRDRGFSGVVRVDGPGEELLVQAYGFADRAHRVPITADTRIGRGQRRQGVHRADRDAPRRGRRARARHPGARAARRRPAPHRRRGDGRAAAGPPVGDRRLPRRGRQRGLHARLLMPVPVHQLDTAESYLGGPRRLPAEVPAGDRLLLLQRRVLSCSRMLAERAAADPVPRPGQRARASSGPACSARRTSAPTSCPPTPRSATSTGGPRGRAAHQRAAPARRRRRRRRHLHHRRRRRDALAGAGRRPGRVPADLGRRCAASAAPTTDDDGYGLGFWLEGAATYLRRVGHRGVVRAPCTCPARSPGRCSGNTTEGAWPVVAAPRTSCLPVAPAHGRSYSTRVRASTGILRNAHHTGRCIVRPCASVHSSTAALVAPARPAGSPAAVRTTAPADERRRRRATSRPRRPARVSAPGDATDLLAEICEKGTLTVSTDPAYPPQSSLNEQTGEYEGFDIDVATEIANRLGVDVAWEAPVLGRHHRRQLERPLGHDRRLDDADQRPAGGPLLHPALQLHAGRRRGRGRQRRRSPT